MAIYNEDLKNQYIAEKRSRVTVNKYYFSSVFGKSKPFEEKYNKDASNFTTAEIEDMLRTLSFTSIDSLAMYTSALSQYTDWCISEKHLVVDSQNHYLEFDVNRLKGLINTYALDSKIVSKETVYSWVDNLDNVSDKFLLLGIFYGIKGNDYSELWLMEDNDVDVINNTLTLHDYKKEDRGKKKYPAELCQYASDSAKEEYYIGFKASEDKKERPPIKLLPSNKVVKEMWNAEDGVSEFRKGRRVYTRIKKIVNSQIDGNNLITGNDIYNSGMIHFINSHAVEKGVSSKEYIKKFKDEITYYYDKRISYKMLVDRYSAYLK